MQLPTKKIIAIGGGEICRRSKDGKVDYVNETAAIDEEILRLTYTTSASLLFIPTASHDSKEYIEMVKKHFLTIGFKSVESLNLYDSSLKKNDIEHFIMSSDAIYVGGGNTLKMMNTWRRMGVDTLLEEASRRGVVLAGISAGSICWFTQGMSKSRNYRSDIRRLTNVTGLGMIDAVICPHANTALYNETAIKNTVKKSAKITLRLDNCSAIEIVGEEYRILSSKPEAKARKSYWHNGQLITEVINSDQSTSSLKELLQKR